MTTVSVAPTPSRHPRLLDFSFAVAYVVAAGSAFLAPSREGWPVSNPALVWTVTVITLLVTVTSLLVRHHFPVISVAACTLGSGLECLLGLGLSLNFLGTALGGLVLIGLQASLARRRDWTIAAPVLVFVVLVAAVVVAVTGQLSGSGTITGVTVGATVLFIASAVGFLLRTQQSFSLEAVAQREAAAAKERALISERAATAARAEVSREMHDVIAHSLTVVISLADTSVALLEVDPTKSRDTMEETAATGRQSLRELRRLLGSESVEPQNDDLAPAPSWTNVPDLVDGFSRAGLSTSLSITGDAPNDASRALAVYRIVQESLTNALRHGVSVQTVSVAIEHRAAGTMVDIIDDGAVVSPRSDRVGKGIRGMRERVALYDGLLDAGPSDRGGWRIHAYLPSKATP